MKKMLTMTEIDSQTALELPERRMLGLVTVVITNVLNNLSVDVTVRNNNVAAQICAVVDLLNGILLFGNQLTCTVRQG